MIITPWLLIKLKGSSSGHSEDEDGGKMGRFYKRVAQPLLQGRSKSKRFLTIVGVATIAACGLFYTKSVTVKLLPFDNKSEIQVVVDLPEGASLEATERVTMDVTTRLKDIPELMNMQIYVGTSMPFNFNGLVRHYYLRDKPEYADVQLNLSA